MWMHLGCTTQNQNTNEQKQKASSNKPTNIVQEAHYMKGIYHRESNDEHRHTK
jgi:hypothetical protein